MKRLAFLLLSVVSLPGIAQEWIDLTDAYVVNPRFDNDDRTTGWSGTTLGAANPKENAEHYSKTYDTYQAITGLTEGRYRVSLNAFYRMGDSNNDYSLYSSGDYANYQYAQLYAITSVDDYSVAIAPASSAALSNSLGGAVSSVGDWWSGRKYIPNNMEAAYYWFEAGYYDNSVECRVTSDGELTIGIRKDETISSDWTCIDNWRLELWGTVTKVTSITLSATSLDMVLGEMHDLTATVRPQNATYKNVSWSSSDPTVATVDSKGQITAVGTGVCYVVATAKDGSGKTARCRVTVTKTMPSAENIIINEIMAANVDVYLDPSMNYGCWVELYNPTSKSVSLGGLYVTDDPMNLTKHRLIDTYGVVPAGGYALLNFDHHEVWTPYAYRQIDDKLNAEGGFIIVSDGTTIIAQQYYPQAISRTSYARTTDGGSTWGVTGNPSPAASNEASGGFATTQLAAPVVDRDGGLFTGSVQVRVAMPAGATLRYTTDGTTPTLTNGQTSATGVFTVSDTRCYRFRLFQEGYLPSPVVTRSYIYDNGNYPFPIISLVTDLGNIYDQDRGAFGQGAYGRPGNGQTSNCNWNMDWDRPVAFEYITADGECIVSQECDFSMCGGWSRAWTPHSFKLKANKIYDLNNFFAAPLFPEKPYIKNKTLQIRNGGNDTSCRIKDAAVQQVVARSGLYVDYQSWQPVHVFINGDHYAVLNMREPNNKHYAYANYGIDTDEMDQFEISPDSGYVQMTGTDESFLRLLQLSQNAADAATYAEIGQLLDIDEYINYMAVELYAGSTDWPQNNVKGFRDQNDGRFRFVLFDLDFALNTSTPFSTFFWKQNYTFDTLHGYDYSINQSVEGQCRQREITFVTLFRNMLQNDSFRKQFIDTYCLVSGSVFHPDHVRPIVTEMRDYLATGYYVYPSSSANQLMNGFSTSWRSSVMNDLVNCADMQLSSATRQEVSLSANIDEAKILVNGLELPYTQFDGYLFSPITLKAQAPSGYRFEGWAGLSATVQKSLFDRGSSWKYYDQGSLDGQNWTASNYNDASWSTGTGIIGYDYNYQHPDIVTETNGNLTCYYFRKTVTLDETPGADDVFTLDYTIDDGMIVYVNGTEAGRYNMPSGTATYSTVATTYAHGNPDTGTMTLDGSLFRQGTNTIAVEVHNNQTSSTDILWDASLSLLTESGDYVSTDEEYTLPSTGVQRLKAVYTKVEDESLLASLAMPIKVNEVSAGNTMYINDLFKKNDWLELYNTTDTDLDVAGLYISDDVDDPCKYQIPSGSVEVNTVIPAKGHLIVWADKLTPVSQLHATFKLGNADGEMVLVTSSDEFVDNNAAFFTAHPSLRDFADGLAYNAHSGDQSVGRYPDGGNIFYQMSRPTIEKTNTLMAHDVQTSIDEGIMDINTTSFSLQLAEGWNWVSHPLSQSIAVNQLKDHADRILSQTQEAYYSSTTHAMEGLLKRMERGSLYKIEMADAYTYTFDGQLPSSVPPTVLRAGWNWIGYPALGSQTLAAALAGSPVEEGDIIVGQSGFSTYSQSKGWTGTLSSLSAGVGYMYKSASAKALRFHPSASTVKLRKSERRAARSGCDRHAYPNVMGIIAQVQMEGETLDAEHLQLMAYSDGECRGEGEYVDGAFFLTLYGQGGEPLTFKVVDDEGTEYSVSQRLSFMPDVVGTTAAPYVFSIAGETTDIASTPTQAVPVGYYNLSGTLVAGAQATLRPGIYIVRYSNGQRGKILVR